jgi:hypothetical protein
MLTFVALCHLQSSHAANGAAAEEEHHDDHDNEESEEVCTVWHLL